MADTRTTDLAEIVSLVGNQGEIAAALRGAMTLLEPQLIWTERQHDSGAWHVTVTIADCEWFGNDGHLLSESREECRFMAFASLMQCLSDGT